MQAGVQWFTKSGGLQCFTNTSNSLFESCEATLNIEMRDELSGKSRIALGAVVPHCNCPFHSLGDFSSSQN